MTKVKLNLNQTHCCGIYSDKTVYSFTAGSYPELFYLLQRRGLIDLLSMETSLFMTN